MLASIGWPILDRFRFGSRFAISPHGIFIAIGFMFGVWLLGKIGPKRGIPAEEVNAIGFWSLIGAIIGVPIAAALQIVAEELTAPRRARIAAADQQVPAANGVVSAR